MAAVKQSLEEASSLLNKSTPESVNDAVKILKELCSLAHSSSDKDSSVGAYVHPSNNR